MDRAEKKTGRQKMYDQLEYIYWYSNIIFDKYENEWGIFNLTDLLQKVTCLKSN